LTQEQLEARQVYIQKVMKQQEKRRKETLVFREKRDGGDMAITAKNYKAL